MRGALHFDVVVIGAGTAGLTAATRLAQAGAKVCVVAKGQGSTHLAPATIDVAGYSPAPGPAPVPAVASDPDESESSASPASSGAAAARPSTNGSAAAADHAPAPPHTSATAGIEALCKAHDEHPYNKLGAQTVADALEWFRAAITDYGPAGYAYVGSLDENVMLPTAIGALRPSALVPTTMIGGDATTLTRVAVIGAHQLRDFHPNVCAENLKRVGIDARAFTVPLLLDAHNNRADIGPLHLARAADDPAWRARFCLQLQSMIGDAEQVALPAVLGLADPASAHADFEQQLGRRVFEIPTLPPSVPGVRMYEALRAALRAAHGRLVLGPEVISATRAVDGRATSVVAHAAGHDSVYEADHFVLASGGFNSGGIELDSQWVTREHIFGLTLAGLPDPGTPRFGESYFGEQPMARVGIATDPDLRAEGAQNVLVAGAAVAGAVPWREASGEGIAITSGYRAAAVIAGELTTGNVATV